MRIEVLYFSGCPNHARAVERIREVLGEENQTAEIVEIEAQDAEAAQRLKFLGSPTIRVNGVDIEPEARTRTEYSMACRTYAEGRRRTGLPPRELIRAALREAAAITPVTESAGL
jgi:hypothetical protein